ncbi:hypothetical protein KSP39_PZI001940 [Platanthera zijinensis]|uniref:Wound-responsive family protein n=1 Tax=Platanthera zijinensis TaxID=2320716 RepID=A0AAP0GE10_9ASPA
MSSASRASSWIAAASISAVEALKDQGGLCRWNYALRSLHNKAKKEMSSLSQATKMTSSSSSSALVAVINRGVLESKAEGVNRAEESLRKVMYLSCWGPN